MRFLQSGLLALVLVGTVAVAGNSPEMKAFAPLDVLGDNTSVFASGAWDLNIPPTTRNAMVIHCDHHTMACVGAEAYVDQPSGIFSVHLYDWNVIAWTDAEVTAAHVEACTTATLIINFAFKEVIHVTRNGGALKGGCTPSILDLAKPITKKLISGGWTVWPAK